MEFTKDAAKGAVGTTGAVMASKGLLATALHQNVEELAGTVEINSTSLPELPNTYVLDPFFYRKCRQQSLLTILP